MKTKKSSLLFKISILLALLVSLYVSVLRQGLSVLPDLEHHLALRASELSGTDIQLQGTQGFLKDFKPHISIEKITIKTPTGQLLASTEQLSLSINFWESLKARTFVFDQIYLSSGNIYAPQKSYVRIKGKKVNYDLKRWNRWLAIIFQQDNIWIRNLNFYADGINLHLVDLIQQHTSKSAKRSDSSRQSIDQVGLEADLTFDVKGILTQGRLQAFVGDSEDPLYQGRLNVKLRQFDQSLLQLPFIQDSIESHLLQRFMTFTQAELWASWDDFQLGRFHLETTLDQGFDKGMHLVVSGEKKAKWSIAGYIQQGLSRSTFNAQTPHLTVFNEYRLAAADVPLDFVAQLNRMLVNPSSQLNLDGTLKNIQLQKGELSFDVRNAVIQRQGLQIGTIDGHLRTDFTDGIFQLNQQAIDLEWPEVFPDTLRQIQLERNALYWRRSQSFLKLKSPDFKFTHNDAIALLSWTYTIPKTGNIKDVPELELLAEINSPTPNQYQRYLPQFLPEGFLNWMNQAVVSGHLNHGRFLYHGALKKLPQDVMDGFAGPDFMTKKQKSEINRNWPYLTPPPSLQMNFIGTDLDFQFSRDWPQVKKANVDVLVAQKRVAFDILNGESVGLDAQGHGEVVFFQKPLLDLSLNIKGQFKQGIQYLLNSPAGSKIEPVMPIVDIQSGRIDSNMALTLDFEQRPLKPRIEVTTDVIAGQAYLKPIHLPLTGIQGRTVFSLEDGLRAENMNVTALKQQFNVNIQKNKEQTDVLWQGPVSAQALLDWMKWPLFKTMNGYADINGHLSLPWHERPVTLVIGSNLAGLGLDWPDDFAKSTTEQRHWRMAAQLGNEPIFDLFDENHYRARLAMKDGSISGFELTLGDTYNTGTDINLGHVYSENRLKADLASIDLKTWSDFIRKLQEPMDEQSNQHESKSSTDVASAQKKTGASQLMPQSAQIQVGQLAWGEHAFGQIGLSMNEEPGGWRIQWDGPNIAGKGFIAKNTAGNKSAWRFAVDRLDLPATLLDSSKDIKDEQTVTAEQIAEVPSDTDISGLFGRENWPALFFEFLNLKLDGQYLGRTEIAGEPIVGGYSWKNLYGQLAGIHFRGEGYALTDGAEFDFEFKGGRLDQIFEIFDMKKAPLESSVIDGKIGLRLPFNQSLLDGLTTKGQVSIDDGVISGVNGVSPLRWLSLLNAEQFARRLQLDFSGLTQSGLVFDSLKIDWTSNGPEIKNSGLHLKSPSIELKTKGWINLKDKNLNQACVAIIPIMDHLLIPAAAAGGLPAAATAYVIDKALGDQLDALTELKWTVKGSLSNPKVER